MGVQGGRGEGTAAFEEREGGQCGGNLGRRELVHRLNPEGQLGL